MQKRLRLLFTVSLLFIGVATWMPSARAATLVLMVLEHIDKGQRVQTQIEAKAGASLSPTRGKGHDKWTLLPGNGLVVDGRPTEVTVELYRGTDAQRTLLCAVAVRYFRDSNGVWLPHYRIDQEAMIVRGRDGRWQPVTVTGAAALILTSSTLPNAEGYYPWLEFISSGEPLQIDSWVVK